MDASELSRIVDTLVSKTSFEDVVAAVASAGINQAERLSAMAKEQEAQEILLIVEGMAALISEDEEVTNG